MYHVFAGGGKFICNYRFRQPLKESEQYHYGLMQTDGVTLTPGGQEYKKTINEIEKSRAAYKKNNRMPLSIASRRIRMMFTMNNNIKMNFQPQTNQWNTMGHVHKYYKLLKSLAAPIHELVGISNLFFDHLPSDYWGHISFNGESYGWSNHFILHKVI